MTGDLESSIRQWLKGAILDAIREALPELKQVLSTRSQTEPADAPRLFRPRDTAAAIGISERHLHKLTQEGIIPAIRLGRVVRYSSDGLSRWIADNELKVPSRSIGHGSGPSLTVSRVPYSENASTASPSTRATSRSRANKPAKRHRTAVSMTKAVQAKALPAEHTARLASKRSSKRTAPPACDAVSPPRDPSDFDKIVRRLGISADGLPSVTGADIMRIAGIDANMLHGFLCFDRDLPESAVTRLREFFLEHSKVGQPGKGHEDSAPS